MPFKRKRAKDWTKADCYQFFIEWNFEVITRIRKRSWAERWRDKERLLLRRRIGKYEFENREFFGILEDFENSGNLIHNREIFKNLIGSYERFLWLASERRERIQERVQIARIHIVKAWKRITLNCGRIGNSNGSRDMHYA